MFSHVLINSLEGVGPSPQKPSQPDIDPAANSLTCEETVLFCGLALCRGVEQ